VSLDDSGGDFTLQLSNTGNLPTSLITLGTTGDFTIIPAGTTCGPSGALTLAPAAACTLIVRFVPTAGGPRTGAAVATASQGAPPPDGAPAALNGDGQWRLQVSTSGASGNVTSSPPGIDCGSTGSTCSRLFDHGTAVTLTATPSAGFNGWTGCAPVSGQPAQCTLTLDGAGATGGVYPVAAAFQ
jgi:hypothetical protein